MKKLLFCLLALPLMGEPVFVQAGGVPDGMTVQGYRDTGSMRPALVGDGFVWGVPYQKGMPLKKKDWVCLIRSCDGKAVLHEITALNERAVYTSGINSRYSDGWSPRSAVFFVVKYVERRPVAYTAQVSAALR